MTDQSENSILNNKDYKSLSLDQLKKLLNQKKQIIRENYIELTEKERIIPDIKKIDKLNEKIKKGVNIKKNGKINIKS